MKNFSLPNIFSIPLILLFFLSPLFFWPAEVSAQSKTDCWSKYEKEDYQCLTGFTKCNNACVDQAKDSDDYGECTNSSCDPQSEACHQQAQGNYRVCLKGEKNTSVDAVLKEPSNTKSQEECYRAYQSTVYECLQTRTSCIWDCTDLDNQKGCAGVCEAEDRTCSDAASAVLKACSDANNNSSVDAVSKPQLPQELPSGVVSSKNLKSLLRAMNEFQKAQAELEEIKKENNPAWQAKKDFARQYNEALEGVPNETKLRLKALRTKLEYIKDAAGVPGDIEDLSNYLQGKGFGPSSRAGKAAEVGEGIITFLDLMNEGASFENAATKATIDTVAPTMFYVFPPLKAAELVATLPDDIMGAIGIPKDHWSRTTTGYLAKNSPSAFVEVTTSAMVKTNTWTNVGGAFQVAWDDFKSAEGIAEKAEATLGLVGTTVGAIPVAITMRARDQVVTAVEVFKLGAKGAGSFVSSLFTWPN